MILEIKSYQMFWWSGSLELFTLVNRVIFFGINSVPDKWKTEIGRIWSSTKPDIEVNLIKFFKFLINQAYRAWEAGKSAGSEKGGIEAYCISTPVNWVTAFVYTVNFWEVKG